MVIVVMTTSIAALLTFASLSSATAGLRQGVEARHAVDVRALADAGASRALSHITDDVTYTTHVAGATMDRAWVLSVLSSAPLEVSTGGELGWIVPDSGDVIFGLGFVPDRATATETTIVRVTYERVDPSGFGAFTAAASLTLSGSTTIAGLGGSVHSNGDLAVQGNAYISGDATASGAFTKDPTATVSGSSGGSTTARVITATTPSAYRSMTTHDLCPDTTVRLTAAIPCTGSIQGNGVTGWHGWTFSAPTWSASSATALDGALYVYRGSALIAGSGRASGSPWLLTLVTESLTVGSVTTNGDITISGSGSMRPFTSGVGLVSHRDISVAGSASLEGILQAGEQISLSGTAKVVGQLIAAGAANTVASPVNTNTMSGSARIDAVSTAPQITGGVQPLDWTTL